MVAIVVIVTGDAQDEHSECQHAPNEASHGFYIIYMPRKENGDWEEGGKLNTIGGFWAV